MLPAIASAGRPVELNTTLITGMLMFGKISVGVRSADAVPKIRISTAMTINVYGRRRARRTTPIITFSLVNDVAVAPPILAATLWTLARQTAHAVLTTAMRNIRSDKPESRVEFRIRKMHSLHPHMRILNCGGVAVT